jgi:hypothetical protein
MTQLSPQMDAALRGPAPILFGAVSIELPGRQINLLDGAGMVTFGGKTYVGRDPTYGTLASIENLTDGMGDDAPALTITLLPASDAAAADLAAPTMQGAPVTIHLGALDRLTGLVIPDPTLLFLGELDVPVLRSTGTGRSLDYEVVSAFERLFTDDERVRLSPGFHRSVWPGEAGLDFVTGVQETVFWGVAGTNGAIAYQNSGGMADRGREAMA